jgi:hypothetical protein
MPPALAARRASWQALYVDISPCPLSSRRRVRVRSGEGKLCALHTSINMREHGFSK